MNVKHFILTGVFALVAGMLEAQEPTDSGRRAVVEAHGDSIIIRKGSGDMRIRVYEDQPGDSGEETEIYEGVYVERIEADKRTFLDALPLIPKKKNNLKRYYGYDPHVSGVYVGFASISNQFLTFSPSNRIPLDRSQTWEFGFGLLSFSHNFDKRPNVGINVGLSWGYRSFNIDGNCALLKADGGSYLAYGDENTTYDKSRLRHFFFRVPLLLEYQHKKFFVNAGPEFEVRHSVKSFSHVNGGKKQTVAKGLYVRPVGVNLLVQAGYNNIGVYLRYSNNLFQKDKGIDVNPFSFGIAWYW